MVTGFVVAGVTVHVVESFQRRMLVAPKDVRRADGFTIA
jgi:hypothetical protein